MSREQDTTSRDRQPQNDRSHDFFIGLLAGTVVGGGLGWMFAERLSALGRQTVDSAKHIGAAAADRYDEAGKRVATVVNDITEKGQDLRDQLSDAVIHGARAVEHQAEQMKSGR